MAAAALCSRTFGDTRGEGASITDVTKRVQLARRSVVYSHSGVFRHWSSRLTTPAGSEYCVNGPWIDVPGVGLSAALTECNLNAPELAMRDTTSERSSLELWLVHATNVF